jgi:hypothetical protein
MKKVTVNAAVVDVHGLYIALRKAYFDVANIGSDKNGTYVYLADVEDKDPVSIVESWVGKVPAPLTSKEEIAARKAELEALPAPGAPPVSMLEVDGAHILGLPDADTEVVEAAPVPDPVGTSVLSKFFRRIW